ncbi:DsbA family protein [Nonomuraea sp. CA-141351]|uniref:DsbA family protein n=1 Tax=Nonomuraea sp. CA-141351 TaxID=3239996 RepID=UPI003D8D98A0
MISCAERAIQSTSPRRCETACLLASLASEAGLDAPAVREMLARGDLADAVRAEERRAGELGVSGVPAFVFGDRYAVSGGQPVETFARLLDRTCQAGTGNGNR